jgi:thymidine kinase
VNVKIEQNFLFIYSPLMSVTLILGPMFARKTTQLIYYAEQADYGKQRKRILSVKPKIDDRYDENDIVTHSGLHIVANVVSKLGELSEPHIMNDVDIILIDEGQFFDDIYEFCTRWMATKKIVVAGLNGDSNMRPFKNIADLLPLASQITMCKAWCNECGNEANFTKRFTAANTQVLIGGKELYKAVCIHCFTQ